MRTLPSVLAQAAATDSAYVFVDGREHETRLSFAELNDGVLRAAGFLASHRIGPGDRVALVLPTSPAFLYAIYGCQRLGAVPVPLYPPVRLGRMDEYVARTVAMLDAVDASALISDKRVRRILGRVVEARPTPLIKAEELTTGEAFTGPEPLDDDLAMVQFSSGTTVAPKPVGLTHRQVLANVDAILARMRSVYDGPQIGACWLPLYHDMGLIGCVFSAIAAPGDMVLIAPEQFLAKPHLWLRAIDRHRVTVSPAPNFAYALCTERVQDEQLSGCDLSSWRFALNGAEPVAPASLRAFTARFAEWGLRQSALTPVYGLAEASLALTFSDPAAPVHTAHVDRHALAAGVEVASIPPSDTTTELASVGTPLDGFDVQIRDAERHPVGEGIVGRVWARGPSIMRGYLDRTEQPFDGDWLDTGDLGLFMGGQLFITGRAKDVVVLRGQNHAPHDIERAVDDVDGVRTGCAVAVGDVSAEGERLLVFVEVREPSDAVAQACEVAVRSHTGLTPDLVTVLQPGTIPRTSSGKLRRSETLKRFHAGTLLPPDSTSAWRMAGHLARSMLGWARSAKATS